MRYVANQCAPSGLGVVGANEPLGQIVVRSGNLSSGMFSRSFAFRPSNWNYPYWYYQPQYQYQDQSCPVSIALTTEQTAALRAGQIITVSARNSCGAIIQVTVQGNVSAGVSVAVVRPPGTASYVG